MGYTKNVVSFLDILGTRDNNDFDSKYKVHRAFHDSILDCEKRDRLEASYYRKVFSFSDCAYIFHGCRENFNTSIEDEDRLIQTAFINTTLTVIRLLNEGYLVRGGISFEDTYHDELSFFGPSVEEAYILESKKAIVPKILISAPLGQRAKNFSDRAHDQCFGKRNPNFALLPKRSYIPELVQQDNNAYHLNPFYILEMDDRMVMGEHEFTHEALTKAVSAAIERQIPLHPWESPVRAKLEWMKEYVAKSKSSLEDPSGSIAFTK